MTLIQNLTNLANSDWIIPLVIWSLVWKGISLWKCGRNNQLYWFIAILILNTAGILPIIYLLWFQGRQQKIN